MRKKKVVHLRCFQAAKKRTSAFSLVEMLMALLVASLLLAALAPVMTRRMGENVTVNSDVNFGNNETEIRELTYGMNDEENHIQCVEPDDVPEADYCEGTFVVPDNVYQLKVIAIGAGGGGGTAPTAGFVEYTDPDASNNFTVPAMVNKIEATLVSGGAGGGAGGQIETEHTFVTGGNGGVTTQSDAKKLTVLTNATGTWTVPEIARGKNALVTGCGGGGGGGGTGSTIDWSGSGGDGSYTQNALVQFGNQASANIYIGGGGGGGGSDDGRNAGKGRPYGGGGGGMESSPNNTNAVRTPGSDPGGDGGYANYNSAIGALFALGGGGNNGVGGDGSIAAENAKGGAGAGGGAAGGQGNIVFGWMNVTAGGGGGGGSEGGGGGGAGGGGGGGGGGGATLIKQNGNVLFNVGGGGGGGGISSSIWGDKLSHAIWNGGGGGGGTGAGYGGGSARDNLGGGYGANASYSTIWGGKYCKGGTRGTHNPSGDNGVDGNDGAMTIKYLSHGPGGSGGGGGSIVPTQPINAISGEVLNIVIGKGSAGYTAGKIESSDNIIKPLEAGAGMNSRITITSVLKNSSLLLATDDDNGYQPVNGCSNGNVNLDTSPFCSNRGWMHNGKPFNEQIVAYENSLSGNFGNSPGKSAGNTNANNKDNVTYANGTIGGDGGQVKIFGNIVCTPGKGGTENNPTGGDASGYGCGGGGGYGLANGGAGSSGYTRLSWNMYWDIALNSGNGAYRYAETGFGGGGASGNTIISGLDVIPGNIIRFRIGKGGAGAYVSENSAQDAKSGGTTVFGCSGTGRACSGGIRAGGGGGGGNPIANSGEDVQNGAGGSASDECKAGGGDYLHNANVCTIGTDGSDSSNSTNGGKGANYSTPSALSKYSKRIGAEAISGTGGEGGQRDTGDNANGKAGRGIAAGGGGASIRYSTAAIERGRETGNANTGGGGANGKIILEWIKM